MTWFGSGAEWLGFLEGVVLTLLAQWAWRAWHPVKKEVKA